MEKKHSQLKYASIFLATCIFQLPEYNSSAWNFAFDKFSLKSPGSVSYSMRFHIYGS